MTLDELRDLLGYNALHFYPSPLDPTELFKMAEYYAERVIARDAILDLAEALDAEGLVLVRAGACDRFWCEAEMAAP